MKRIAAVAKNAESPSSVVWGKINNNQINNKINNQRIGAVGLAALLLACVMSVGCSSDKPRAANTSSQIPLTPPQTTASASPRRCSII